MCCKRCLAAASDFTFTSTPKTSRICARDTISDGLAVKSVWTLSSARGLGLASEHLELATMYSNNDRSNKIDVSLGDLRSGFQSEITPADKDRTKNLTLVAVQTLERAAP